MGEMTKSDLKRQVILIVDDEESIRRTLTAVFGDEGFGAVSAGDGESALKIIDDTPPSLVLLDIWMPGMDGIETLKQIKQRQPAMPVIMISGHATIPTAIQATRLGAAEFIEKPLDLDNTIRSVKRVLGLLCEERTDAKALPAADGGTALAIGRGDATHEIGVGVLRSPAYTIRGCRA